MHLKKKKNLNKLESCGKIFNQKIINSDNVMFNLHFHVEGLNLLYHENITDKCTLITAYVRSAYALYI